MPKKYKMHHKKLSIPLRKNKSSKKSRKKEKSHKYVLKGDSPAKIKPEEKLKPQSPQPKPKIQEKEPNPKRISLKVTSTTSGLSPYERRVQERIEKANREKNFSEKETNNEKEDQSLDLKKSDHDSSNEIQPKFRKESYAESNLSKQTPKESKANSPDENTSPKKSVNTVNLMIPIPGLNPEQDKQALNDMMNRQKSTSKEELEQMKTIAKLKKQLSSSNKLHINDLTSSSSDDSDDSYYDEEINRRKARLFARQKTLEEQTHDLKTLKLQQEIEKSPMHHHVKGRRESYSLNMRIPTMLPNALGLDIIEDLIEEEQETGEEVNKEKATGSKDQSGTSFGESISTDPRTGSTSKLQSGNRLDSPPKDLDKLRQKRYQKRGMTDQEYIYRSLHPESAQAFPFTSQITKESIDSGIKTIEDLVKDSTLDFVMESTVPVGEEEGDSESITYPMKWKSNDPNNDTEENMRRSEMGQTVEPNNSQKQKNQQEGGSYKGNILTKEEVEELRRQDNMNKAILYSSKRDIERPSLSKINEVDDENSSRVTTIHSRSQNYLIEEPFTDSPKNAKAIMSIKQQPKKKRRINKSEDTTPVEKDTITANFTVPPTLNSQMKKLKSFGMEVSKQKGESGYTRKIALRLKEISVPKEIKKLNQMPVVINKPLLPKEEVDEEKVENPKILIKASSGVKFDDKGLLLPSSSEGSNSLVGKSPSSHSDAGSNSISIIEFDSRTHSFALSNITDTLKGKIDQIEISSMQQHLKNKQPSPEVRPPSANLGKSHFSRAKKEPTEENSKKVKSDLYLNSPPTKADKRGPSGQVGHPFTDHHVIPKYNPDLSPNDRSKMFKINLIGIGCQSIKSEIPKDQSKDISPKYYKPKDQKKDNLATPKNNEKRKGSFYTSKWTKNRISMDSSIDRSSKATFIKSSYSKSSNTNKDNTQKAQTQVEGITPTIQSEDVSPRYAFSEVEEVTNEHFGSKIQNNKGKETIVGNQNKFEARKSLKVSKFSKYKPIDANLGLNKSLSGTEVVQKQGLRTEIKTELQSGLNKQSQKEEINRFSKNTTSSRFSENRRKKSPSYIRRDPPQKINLNNHKITPSAKFSKKPAEPENKNSIKNSIQEPQTKSKTKTHSILDKYNKSTTKRRDIDYTTIKDVNDYISQSRSSLAAVEQVHSELDSTNSVSMKEESLKKIDTKKFKKQPPKLRDKYYVSNGVKNGNIFKRSLTHRYRKEDEGSRFSKYGKYTDTTHLSTNYSRSKTFNAGGYSRNQRLTLDYSKFQEPDSKIFKAEKNNYDQERPTAKKEIKINEIQTPNFNTRPTFDAKKYASKPIPLETESRKIDGTESQISQITENREATQELKTKIESQVSKNLNKQNKMRQLEQPVKAKRKLVTTTPPLEASKKRKYSLNFTKQSKPSTKNDSNPRSKFQLNQKEPNSRAMVKSMVAVSKNEDLSETESIIFQAEDFGDEDLNEFTKISDRIFDSYDRSGQNKIIDKEARHMLEHCYTNFKPEREVTDEDALQLIACINKSGTAQENPNAQFISRDAFRKKVVHYLANSGLFVPSEMQHGVRKSTRHIKSMRNIVASKGFSGGERG